jgi:hypothetical protein
MRNTDDLDRLDAATLRAWRSMNLIGWGLAGAVVATLAGLAINVVNEQLYLQGHGNVLVLPGLILAGIAGGSLIGARVYRWPGTVAFVAIMASSVIWIAWESITHQVALGAVGIAVELVFSLVVALPATIAGRVVWRHRPASLRYDGPAAA